MRAQQFENYLQAPERIDAAGIADLQLLVNEFPYFQAAHVLLTLAAKQHDPRIYQSSLRKTAIVVSSRSRLFQLVEQLEARLQAPAEAGPQVEVPTQAAAPESKEERQILQAAELSTANTTTQAIEAPDTIEPVEAEIIPAKEEPIVQLEAEQKEEISAVEMLGREIGRELVTAQISVEIEEAAQEQSKPVEDPESFGDWLTYLKKNNGQSYADITEKAELSKAKNKEKERERIESYIEKNEERKQKNKAIIDNIIEKNPGLIRQKEEPKFFAPDTKAKESLLENEHLVTETLARIYALQGSVNKAVRAYEILSLKYPQKSAYFASLIQKLKHN
jgi:hypothetical protein